MPCRSRVSCSLLDRQGCFRSIQLCCRILQQATLLRHGHRGILDHVFLPADHFLAAQLNENVPRRDTKAFRRAFGVQQEGGLHPGKTQRQGFAVNAHHVIHHRHDNVFSHVHQFEQVNTRDDTHAVTHGSEHFQRGIARPGTEPGD